MNEDDENDNYDDDDDDDNDADDYYDLIAVFVGAHVRKDVAVYAR